MTLEQLVEKFIALRDKRQEMKSEYEQRVAHIDSLMQKIEGILLKTLDEQGLQSVKTPSGTAYRSTRTSATIADWDAFLGHVREHDAYEMLERRCSKSAVEQYKAANDDLPPGVNWREEVVVNFRRS